MLNDLIKKLTRRKMTSSQEAKKRLKFALVYDNLEVSDELLDSLRQDIVDVISRYFEINTSEIKLDIDRREEYSSLVLNTPILSTIRR